MFMGVARILQECFKGIKKTVSKVFQGSFKVVLGKFQQCVKIVSKAHPESFKELFKGVSGKLDISKGFTGISRKFCFLILFCMAVSTPT